MEMTALDSLLLLQLTVARLGEKELLGWWNTDIVYKLGGADFLNRLVGSTFAPLAAGEAVLMAARMKEEQGLAAIPGESAYTLFCPEPRLRSELTHRFRHFKTYRMMFRRKSGRYLIQKDNGRLPICSPAWVPIQNRVSKGRASGGRSLFAMHGRSWKRLGPWQQRLVRRIRART